MPTVWGVNPFVGEFEATLKGVAQKVSFVVKEAPLETSTDSTLCFAIKDAAHQKSLKENPDCFWRSYEVSLSSETSVPSVATFRLIEKHAAPEVIIDLFIPQASWRGKGLSTAILGHIFDKGHSFIGQETVWCGKQEISQGNYVYPKFQQKLDSFVVQKKIDEAGVLPLVKAALRNGASLGKKSYGSHTWLGAGILRAAFPPEEGDYAYSQGDVEKILEGLS